MTLTLERIADILETAPRRGRWPERDRRPGAPERPVAPSVAAESGAVGETDRYITISDAMAREMAATLRHYARGESPRAVALERRGPWVKSSHSPTDRMCRRSQ
ncbi:MAG: hypothetical protein OEU25_23520 [Rhodospirillales bacterium]|nr:hypothetical protein [Rhodospirillales bacterium]